MKTSYYVCVILEDDEEQGWEHQYEQPVPIPEVGERVSVVSRDEQDAIIDIPEFEVVRRTFDYCDGLVDQFYEKSVWVNLYVRPAKGEAGDQPC